jgi:hypothetical protein
MTMHTHTQSKAEEESDEIGKAGNGRKKEEEGREKDGSNELTD